MSVDVSLRIKASLLRHRNVLSRAERVALLKEREGWEAQALGMPKVGHRKPKAGKKAKKEVAADGTAPTTPAAAPAAETKTAKPAGKPGGKPGGRGAK